MRKLSHGQLRICMVLIQILSTFKGEYFLLPTFHHVDITSHWPDTLLVVVIWVLIIFFWLNLGANTWNQANKGTPKLNFLPKHAVLGMVSLRLIATMLVAGFLLVDKQYLVIMSTPVWNWILLSSNYETSLFWQPLSIQGWIHDMIRTVNLMSPIKVMDDLNHVRVNKQDIFFFTWLVALSWHFKD